MFPLLAAMNMLENQERRTAGMRPTSMKPTPELGSKLELQKSHAQQNAPWLNSEPQRCLVERFDARSKQACFDSLEMKRNRHEI